MVNHHGGAILVGGHVYGHSESKGWTCQNFKTGNALWQEKNKLDKGSVVFADRRLYCREEAGDGAIALIEATPAGYREGPVCCPGRRQNNWAHPLFRWQTLRSRSALLCFDVKKK
jgi:hypothetical protein